MAEATATASHFYQLVYMSVRQLGEQGSFFGQDVRNILATARAFNHGAGIGGALLFNGTFFAQVLEGDRDTILGLMTRIVRDFRHSHITIIEEGWVAERAFPDWAMAFADDTTLGALAVPPDFDPGGLAEICTRPAIIEAMRYLIADGQDQDDPPYPDC